MIVSTKTLQIRGLFSPVEFEPGDNLLATLNANKVSIAQSCDGNGSCTTCRVLILNGAENCSERTDIETERALERGFLQNERLACQTFMDGNVEIEILNQDLNL